VWDKEGLVVSFLLVLAPFLLLRMFDRLFPFFAEDRT
jgi:hypothetical protein